MNYGLDGRTFNGRGGMTKNITGKILFGQLRIALFIGMPRGKGHLAVLFILFIILLEPFYIFLIFNQN